MSEQIEAGLVTATERSTASSRDGTKRDLSALIAEKLFGFRWYQRAEGATVYRWLGVASLKGGPWKDADGTEPISPWMMVQSVGDAFTRNIQGGWQVVVEMRRRGYWVDVQSSGLDPELWKITIQKSYDSTTEQPTKKITEAGWSVAEPVCLAALRALDEGVPVPAVDPSVALPENASGSAA